MGSFGVNTNGSGCWNNLKNLKSKKYYCGFCNTNVSSEKGYYYGMQRDGSGHPKQFLFVCPECQAPTLFDFNENQFPSSPGQIMVKHLPESVEKLLNEVFSAYSVRSYTSVVLCCRKILMHIGVDKGAKEGKNFFSYVEYLSDQGFIPPNGKGWVDYIRTKGNEANHEILIMSENDAKQLVNFTVMLLKFAYELPALIPKSD